MSSTENLLQESTKSTNTLESGYHSGDAAEGEQRLHHKQRGRADRKKRFQRNVGLENRGFEGDNERDNADESERVQRDAQVQRTLSDTTPRHGEKLAEYGSATRRHSYAGRSSPDEASTVPLKQNRGKQRRSSSTDADLRRRACLNSMRLRRTTSTIQSRAAEDSSMEDEVFDDDYVYLVPGPGDRNHGFGYQGLMENHRKHASENFTSAVEMENRNLRAYSQRLSSALMERAMLEEQLKLLRYTGSMVSLDAGDNWKKSAEIHFGREKFNSERRVSSSNRGNGTFSLEELRELQTGQNRKLPVLPETVSIKKKDELREITNPAIEQRIEKLYVEKQREKAPQKIVGREHFQLITSEKERNERKIAELAADVEKQSKKGPPRIEGREHFQLITSEKERNERKIAELAAGVEKQSKKGPPRIEGRENFQLSTSEKERNERKIADLAADLWKKLLQGEKFYVGDEPTQDDNSRTGQDDATREQSDSNSQEAVNNRGRGKNNVLERQAPVDFERYLEPSTSYKEAEKHRVGGSNKDVVSKTPLQSLGKTPKSEAISRAGSEPNVPRTEPFRRDQRKATRHKRASQHSSTESLPTENTTPGVNNSQVNNTPQEQVAANRGSGHETQNHSKWFDYMLPPGARRGKRGKAPQETSAQQMQREGADNAPPTIAEKLRYYQELHDKRSEVEEDFDLTDAYMAAEDTEAKQALQRKAAGEAAILRREASALLWKAMNLERICDPNARVRHIYTPY